MLPLLALFYLTPSLLRRRANAWTYVSADITARRCCLQRSTCHLQHTSLLTLLFTAMRFMLLRAYWRCGRWHLNCASSSTPNSANNSAPIRQDTEEPYAAAPSAGAQRRTWPFTCGADNVSFRAQRMSLATMPSWPPTHLPAPLADICLAVERRYLYSALRTFHGRLSRQRRCWRGVTPSLRLRVSLCGGFSTSLGDCAGGPFPLPLPLVPIFLLACLQSTLPPL